MIIITGATGLLGRAIVQQLTHRVPASLFGASVRDPAKATDLEALGVRVRQGDFNNPENLKYAFEGATQVLIVSSNARASGGDPLAQHRNAIAAAKAAGASRIVYTSHMAASALSAFPPMLDHAATGDMLAKANIKWTALRHSFYATSGVAMLGDGLKNSLIEAPADGKVSWTTYADLAEAAAIILAHEGKDEGPTPPLTGSQALYFIDVAKIATELQGKPVQRKTLTNDELWAKISARGAPESVARFALGFFIASRNGEFATVDPTHAKLLDRPLTGMRELMAAESQSHRHNHLIQMSGQAIMADI
jgi:NAD(P)H dehydrogenase (quinone)